jgi:hypothetical protein
VKIRKITHQQAEEFLGNTFSAPTHWPDWNVLVAKHFDTDFYYLGAVEKGSLVGVCPVHRTRHRKWLYLMRSGQFHSIPNGGWIFSDSRVLNERCFPTDWKSSFQSFSLPFVNEFNVAPPEKKAILKKTLVIDLEKSLDAIWQEEIKGKRRNMIRKAQKQGIVIEPVTRVSDLERFYSLYLQSSKKYARQPLRLDFFRTMLFDFTHVRLDIYMAFRQGRQLANVCIISDKNYSIYWLGNQANAFINSGQGELLQWHAIQEMKGKGCKYYDLCYIEKEELPDIYRFKRGFSNNEKDIELMIRKPVSFRILNRLANVLSE